VRHDSFFGVRERAVSFDFGVPTLATSAASVTAVPERDWPAKPTSAAKQKRRPVRGGVFASNSIGAGDEIRTHDPNLGKVVLYP
jgi:hypothetical protein